MAGFESRNQSSKEFERDIMYANSKNVSVVYFRTGEFVMVKEPIEEIIKSTILTDHQTGTKIYVPKETIKLIRQY